MKKMFLRLACLLCIFSLLLTGCGLSGEVHRESSQGLTESAREETQETTQESQPLVPQIDYAALEQAIFLDTLMTVYYDSLSWLRQDADADGSQELFMEMTDSLTGRPVQMLLDAESRSLWSYTTTGAAQFTGFLELDGQIVFENTYSTVGNQLYYLGAWDGSAWEELANLQAQVYVEENGDFTNNVSICHWKGEPVTQEEFDTLWMESCEVPAYDSPDLHLQEVSGEFNSIVSALEGYLTEHHSCLALERTDFSSDGAQDCIFVLKDGANSWLSRLVSDNTWGGEAFLELSDEAFTVVALEQMENGARLSVSRILPGGIYDPEVMENFFVDEEGGLCFGETRYIYDVEGGYFGQDIDLSYMEEPQFCLLNLLGMPYWELSAYMDIHSQEDDFVSGSIGNVQLYCRGEYDDYVGDWRVIYFHAEGTENIPIDSATNLSMTKGEIWERIYSTEFPWMEPQAVQMGYASSIYYTHPSTGERYRIDLFFDTLGEDAPLTGISVALQ